MDKKQAEFLLQQANESFRNDSRLYWTVFNVLSTINGALVAITVTQRVPRDAATFLAVLGLCVCIPWWNLQMRLKSWLGYWDAKTSELEVQLLDECEPLKVYRDRTAEALKKTLRTWEKKERVFPGWSSRRTPLLIIVLFVLVWLFIFIEALWAPIDLGLFAEEVSAPRLQQLMR